MLNRTCRKLCSLSSAVDRQIIPRNEQFYEECNVKRQYYYVMDLRGQMFVENVVRNIATSMKDIKFLDFMYKNLQYNDTGIETDIPLVSYCGKERNFVTPIDRNSVLVFKDMVRSKDGVNKFKLYYGGTLSQDFDPSKLAFCNETGRMYHELTSHKYLLRNEKAVYGLLHVNITGNYFSDNLIFDSAAAHDKDDDSGSSGSDSDREEKLKLNWSIGDPPRNEVFSIKMI